MNFEEPRKKKKQKSFSKKVKVFYAMQSHNLNEYENEHIHAMHINSSSYIGVDAKYIYEHSHANKHT